LFELSDQIVEQIVFAMEDQENATVVNLETGEVVAAAEGEEFVPPPSWSSREGFRLMEDFLGVVRQPSARRELTEALARGRGVFKAFKAALAAHPEVERAFRDFKLRAMRRHIAVWYDDLREVQGLERLGPEPEESSDLIASDLEIRVVDLATARSILAPLIDEAESESMEHIPVLLSRFEFERLRIELDEESDGLCAFVDDGEGGALGAALAFRFHDGERSLGHVDFLAVREGFRRMGLGRTLLETLAGRFKAEGTALLIVDAPLVPPELEESLAALGYRRFGVRSYLSLD